MSTLFSSSGEISSQETLGANWPPHMLMFGPVFSPFRLPHLHDSISVSGAASQTPGPAAVITTFKACFSQLSHSVNKKCYILRQCVAATPENNQATAKHGSESQCNVKSSLFSFLSRSRLIYCFKYYFNWCISVTTYKPQEIHSQNPHTKAPCDTYIHIHVGLLTTNHQNQEEPENQKG